MPGSSALRILFVLLLAWSATHALVFQLLAPRCLYDVFELRTRLQRFYPNIYSHLDATASHHQVSVVQLGWLQCDSSTRRPRVSTYRERLRDTMALADWIVEQEARQLRVQDADGRALAMSARYVLLDVESEEQCASLARMMSERRNGTRTTLVFPATCVSALCLLEL